MAPAKMQNMFYGVGSCRSFQESVFIVSYDFIDDCRHLDTELYRYNYILWIVIFEIYMYVLACRSLYNEENVWIYWS